MHPAHMYRDHNKKLIAEVERLRDALGRLLSVQSDRCWCHELDEDEQCEACYANAALAKEDSDGK